MVAATRTTTTTYCMHPKPANKQLYPSHRLCMCSVWCQFSPARCTKANATSTAQNACTNNSATSRFTLDPSLECWDFLYKGKSIILIYLFPGAHNAIKTNRIHYRYLCRTTTLRLRMVSLCAGSTVVLEIWVPKQAPGTTRRMFICCEAAGEQINVWCPHTRFSVQTIGIYGRDGVLIFSTISIKFSLILLPNWVYTERTGKRQQGGQARSARYEYDYCVCTLCVVIKPEIVVKIVIKWTPFSVF